jgi:hypothetical protein
MVAKNMLKKLVAAVVNGRMVLRIIYFLVLV